jgi:hypothetical protein
MGEEVPHLDIALSGEVVRLFEERGFLVMEGVIARRFGAMYTLRVIPIAARVLDRLATANDLRHPSILKTNTK